MNLFELVTLLFLFNVMTFGNGPTMIPLLHTHLVVDRGVLTEDQLLYAFTIARVTPGQANLYVAAIGYMLFGMTGAALSTLAIMLPGYLMLPLLGGYERIRKSASVKGFTRGLTTASVGLIFAATIDIGRDTLRQLVPLVVFGATVVMTYLLKWNPILSLIIACVLGILLKMLTGG